MTPILKAFAENQPITHVVEAVRALMLGTPAGDHIMLSIVWSVAILVIAVPLASWLFRRKTSH
jgi:ABC-2 type transport system permease protein